MAYAACPISPLFATGRTATLKVGSVDCAEAPELQHVRGQCHYVWRVQSADDVAGAHGHLPSVLAVRKAAALVFNGRQIGTTEGTADETIGVRIGTAWNGVNEVHIVTGLVPDRLVPRRLVLAPGEVSERRPVGPVTECYGAAAGGALELLAVYGLPADLAAWRAGRAERAA